MALRRRLPVALVAAIVCGLAFDSGGYFPRAWVWSAVVLLWAAAFALVTSPRAGTPVAFSGAAAALAGWALLSATWSAAPAQSVLDARRDLIYVGAVLAVGAALDRTGAAAAPAAVLAAAGVVSVVGVARYLVSGPVDRAEGTVLSWPVGYANAFAALGVVALPAAVALAAHARRAPARSAAAAAVPLLASLQLLASSRGGAAAAVVAVAVLVALDPRRGTVLRIAALLALPAGFAVAVCAWLDPGTSGGGSRALAGVTLAVACGAAALLARAPLVPARGPALRRAVAVALAACVAAAAVVATVLPPRSARAVVGTERAAYWSVARGLAARHPALGAGGGSFGRAWDEHGAVAVYGGALDAHNLYLETLAELGPIGLAILLLALGMPLAQARTAARASRLGAAAAAGYAGFLVHALLDWDWEMPAVTTAAIVLGASTLVLGRRVRPLGARARIALAAAAVLLALAALAGLRSGAQPGAAAAEKAAAACHPAT